MNFWISEYFVEPKNISRTICNVQRSQSTDAAMDMGHASS